MVLAQIRCAVRAVANSSEALVKGGIMCTSALGLCRYATVGSTHHHLCNVSAICSALVNVYGDCLCSESFDANVNLGFIIWKVEKDIVRR